MRWVVAGIVVASFLAGCGSTRRAETIVSTVAAQSGPPSPLEVKRCLQAAGYNVETLGTSPGVPSGNNPLALAVLSLSAAPGASGGVNQATFDLTKPTVGVAAWFEVYETDADAQAAMESSTKSKEQGEEKAAQLRRDEEAGGVVVPEREANSYQSQSAGDVAFVAWEGDPTSAIQACAG